MRFFLNDEKTFVQLRYFTEVSILNFSLQLIYLKWQETSRNIRKVPYFKCLFLNHCKQGGGSSSRRSLSKNTWLMIYFYFLSFNLAGVGRKTRLTLKYYWTQNLKHMMININSKHVINNRSTDKYINKDEFS